MSTSTKAATDPKPKTAAQIKKAERAAALKQREIERKARVAADKAERVKQKKIKAAEKKAAEAEARKAPTPAQVAKQKAKAENKEAKTERDATKAAVAKKLDPIAKEINYRFEKASKLESDADDHRLAAALQLEEARKLCEQGGVKFKTWAEKNVPQSYETIRKLVIVGGSENPKLALEDMRNKNSEANKKHREKVKAERQQAKKVLGAVASSDDEEASDRPSRRNGHELTGLDAMKAAFMALRASEMMAFVTWAATEIGASITSPLDEPAEAAAKRRVAR